MNYNMIPFHNKCIIEWHYSNAIKCNKCIIKIFHNILSLFIMKY